MSWYKTKVDNRDDQTVMFTIPISGQAKTLSARFRYHKAINKWTVTVMDGTTQRELISNVPLVVSNGPDAINDIFGQLQHIGVGNLMTRSEQRDMADFDPFGGDLTQWMVFWGDSDG